MALGELQIEWIPVPDDSPWIGKTLAECGFRAKTGITVIAILREPEPVTGAQPGDTIERGATLVTVGKAGQYPEFRRRIRQRGAGGSAVEVGRVRHRQRELVELQRGELGGDQITLVADAPEAVPCGDRELVAVV